MESGWILQTVAQGRVEGAAATPCVNDTDFSVGVVKMRTGRTDTYDSHQQCRDLLGVGLSFRVPMQRRAVR